MKSMTGFGKADGTLQGRKIKVEISAVNSRRGMDLFVGLPRELASVEPALRELLQKEVSRGRINVSVVMEGNGVSSGKLKLNGDLLKQYLRELKRLAKETGMTDQVSLEFLLRLPGVLGEEKNDSLGEAIRQGICKITARALAEFQRSREREGRFLCRELTVQIAKLDKVVAAIERRKDGVILRFRENLRKRLAESGLEVPLDDERLLKEIVIYSDRCDTTEEITRLRAHFQEAKRLLRTAEAIGRNFDFLLQEIGREVNTIGSKANDLEISRHVVGLKTELEKIREQVQNLE